MPLPVELHQMQLPREVVVGNGTLDLVLPICKKLGFSDGAFVVTGPKTFEIAASRIIDELKDSGISTDYLFVSSSTMEEVEAVEARIQEIRPQVVLGVGGGTKIDVAKLSSARKDTPFMSIPTAASHDGIASPFTSVKGANQHYSIIAEAPMAVIADTSIIVKASHRYTASGCGDVISKHTAVRDWYLAHRVKDEYYGEYAASLALMSAKLVAKNAELIKPGNEKGLRVLLEALISCGVAMSIAGSSRPCSGSEHLFSHALDLIAPNNALHGEQTGVGTILMACLQGSNWRRIKSKLEKVGSPTTAKELGVESQDIIDSLVRARQIRPERYTILNEKVLTEKTATKLAKKTRVI